MLEWRLDSSETDEVGRCFCFLQHGMEINGRFIYLEDVIRNLEHVEKLLGGELVTIERERWLPLNSGISMTFTFKQT